MLEELRIRGLGVIEDAVLPLGPGLTVVTGETGAGKTMIVSGLLLLFGGRSDAARVRTTADQAILDGRVSLPAGSAAADRVRAAGGAVDAYEGSDAHGGSARTAPAQDEIVLRRIVTSAGRSRAHAGGAPVPISLLGELADTLLVVHGQSDQVQLARPVAQRAALDSYAGIDLSKYAVAFQAWRAAAAAYQDRVARAAELRRESDLLAHGIAEIESVAPDDGELEELIRLAGRLGSADALVVAARTAHDALLGGADDSAADSAADVTQLLAHAGRALGQQRDADPELDALTARLTDLGALAADLGAELSRYADGLDADPQRLEQVESRRAQLSALVRKYCDEPDPSLAGVLRWAAAARQRLTVIDVSDDALTALRVRVQETAAVAARLAAEISARRHAAADELAGAVTAELAGLAMPDARLHIEVTFRTVGALPALEVGNTAGSDTTAGASSAGATSAGATADGVDDVQLLLQPHPGAPALPVGRSASGGELSRVMLALEVCLAASDTVPTMVFDEVDAGVGGRAAAEVGRRLARLARDRQVLVVTHLAQVAAFADQHVVVDKPHGGAGDGVTASDVRLVHDEDRVYELARMLAGTDSDTAREHAAELLAQATTAKTA